MPFPLPFSPAVPFGHAFVCLGTFFDLFNFFPPPPFVYTLRPLRRTDLAFFLLLIVRSFAPILSSFASPMCRLLPLLTLSAALLVALCVSVEDQSQFAEQPRAVLLDLIPTELAESKRSPRHFAFAKRARSFAFAKRNADGGWGRAFAFAKRAAEVPPNWDEKRFAFADNGLRRFAFAKRNYRNFAFA